MRIWPFGTKGQIRRLKAKIAGRKAQYARMEQSLSRCEPEWCTLIHQARLADEIARLEMQLQFWKQ